MKSEGTEVETLLEIYKLHAQLADQAASMREGLSKLYSGMVASIVAASILLHRLKLDAGEWALPLLGAVISLSWMASLYSVTGRLSAKQAVLQELEESLPFPFFTKENHEFEKRCVVRRKWSSLLMPIVFLFTCLAWLAVLCC